MLDTIVGLITAVGVAFAGMQLVLQRKERRHARAQFYIERYWEIDDHLVRSEGDPGEERIAFRRYLRLCEDEFEVASLGWLDRREWHVWHEAMASDPARDRLQSALKSVSAGDDEFERLRECLRTEGSTCEPHSADACRGVDPRPRFWIAAERFFRSSSSSARR